MSESHPGLGTEDRWIQRARTQRDLELLDRGVDFPGKKVHPPPQRSRGSLIWIQIDRPREEGRAFLDLAHYESERMSGPCKHRWIVLIEFDRPPRETSGFNSFLRGIGTPAERFLLSIASSAERVRCGEFGIDTAGNFRELEGFSSLFAGAPIKAGERAQIVVLSLKASSRLALCSLDFGALQLRSDCADHAARHPILQIENI